MFLHFQLVFQQLFHAVCQIVRRAKFALLGEPLAGSAHLHRQHGGRRLFGHGQRKPAPVSVNGYFGGDTTVFRFGIFAFFRIRMSYNAYSTSCLLYDRNRWTDFMISPPFSTSRAMILKSWRGASGGVAAAARPCPPALPVYSAPSCADRTSATGGAIPARALPNCPPGIRRTRSVVRGAEIRRRASVRRTNGNRRGNVVSLPTVVGHSGGTLAGDRAVAAGEEARIEGTPLRPASGRRRIHRRPPPLPPPPRRCRRRPGGGGCRQRSGVSRSHAGDGTDGMVPRSPLRIKSHGPPIRTGQARRIFGAFRPKVDHGVSVFRPDSHGCCAGHLGRRRWASPPQSTHCAP